MGRVGFLTSAIAGPALALAATPAAAAPVPPNKQAKANVNVLSGLTIRKLQDLNFATLAVYSAGTATINPTTDVMTTTGGVFHVGGTPYSALFEAVAPTKSVVHIRAPKKAIVVTRVGGTQTMTVDNFTISGTETRNVVAKEPFEFSIGGRLTVNNNQAEGLYVGTFDIDLQYN